ncbi:MAG: ABC transporter ATP-binding protein/permease [Bacilli bacterium]|nr:ABC transporter ATP-binding protein/permease [Bacilli bacterium]
MEKKKGTLRRFISYYKPYKLMFGLDLLAAFIMAGVSVIYPIVTRLIFSKYITETGSDTKMIIICGSILICCYIVRMLLKFIVDYWGHGVGVRMQKDMRQDLFKKFEELPFSYYDEHEIGELMSRLTIDLNDVSELAHHGPETIFISIVSILGSFIYLLTINYVLALIVLCCVPILFTISLVTRKRQVRAFGESRKDIGNINAQLESSLSGIRVTKAFNNMDNEVEYFEKVNQTYVKSKMKAYKYMGIFHSSTNFVVDLFNAVCIIAGAFIVIYTEAFELADYLAFAVSISLFVNPITQLVQFTEQFQDGSAGFRRFIQIMDTPIDEQKEGVIEHIDLTGNIKFNRVFFKYETSEEIINDISFEIKPGETIALVGTSGGGKTTICHLIPNFYHVDDGQIFFDGVDINDISYKALRNNIGIVQQDVFLFNGSIKSNIRYGKLDATEEEIIEASKRANIYDFVMSLPNGFDTKIGERGVKLSGGQKQRISIARVFLKNPSILILDEATSALDNTTEIAIQNSLNELAKDRTSIIVAHRLSTIKNADRIFVINNGAIVESGNHEELMKLNGEYALLYNQQFKLN